VVVFLLSALAVAVFIPAPAFGQAANAVSIAGPVPILRAPPSPARRDAHRQGNGHGPRDVTCNEAGPESILCTYLCLPACATGFGHRGPDGRLGDRRGFASGGGHQM
jgi:hypothetical protein